MPGVGNRVDINPNPFLALKKLLAEWQRQKDKQAITIQGVRGLWELQEVRTQIGWGTSGEEGSEETSRTHDV